MALHLVELLRHDRRERILLPVDGALLEREINLGEGDRRGIRADRLGEHQEQRRWRHAQLHALHVFRLVYRLVRRDVALAVIGERDDLVLGLVLVAFRDVAKQRARAISHEVIEVAQHVWRVGDRYRLVDRASKRDTGVDHVHGAEAEAFVDLVLVAELRGRKHLDLVAAAGALLDFLRGPQRFRMIRLRDLVDVRPFQFGLSRCGRGGDRGGNNHCAEQCAARRVRHESSSRSF